MKFEKRIKFLQEYYDLRDYLKDGTDVIVNANGEVDGEYMMDMNALYELLRYIDELENKVTDLERYATECNKTIEEFHNAIHENNK